MRYPGGKNGAGVVHRIINQMPPHDLYVEAFAGSAAVYRAKLPASRSVLIDRDAAVIAALSDEGLEASTTAIIGDAVRWLRKNRLTDRAVVYCDPPYLPSCRSHRRIYRCELLEDGHRELLGALGACRARVILSGYPSLLYSTMLPGWRTIEYRAMTRGGPRIECLWMNFPEPVELHDYRYLGENFRERERLRRQQRRWVTRLAQMNHLQRLALSAAIAGHGEVGRRSAS